MRRVLQGFSLFIAIGFGLATLAGLLFSPVFPELGNLITAWATFIAAAALLLGIFNLFLIHLQRAVRANIYSVVLILSMVLTFAVAYTDSQGWTNGLFNGVFLNVLRPLEAALASLLAFFLLFAGFRLLQRQRNGWSVLFISAAIFFLIANAPMPAALGNLFGWVQDYVTPLFVHSGVRAILIGVALGTITLALRLLAGVERPYNK
jgi:hypothetical protein